jgi:hypothetical protein
MNMPAKTPFDFTPYLATIEESGWLPEAPLCVYSVGSLVLGWGNETSDADFVVITEEPWEGETNRSNPTSSDPGVVLSLATYIGDRRVDVEYWQDSHIEQIIGKVSWQRFDNNKRNADLVTNHDFEVLQRIGRAKALRGAEWLDARRAQIGKSALRAIGIGRNFHLADIYLEDAGGQLRAHDLKSAVLSARIAFGYSIDALLFSTGGVGGNTPANKWRARHLGEVDQDVISFDEYWAIETMRDYSDEDAADWVEKVIRICRRISLEVPVA